MDALFEIGDRDVLAGWLGRRGRHRQPAAQTSAGLRFAFYARTSTEAFQDPATSWAWQREVAESVIAGHGVITAEFFDVGCSRQVPWSRRPHAAALLQEATDVDRCFDAVVVGEFERAFTERQFHQVLRLLRPHGVTVWLPETAGPVDEDDPAHQMLMNVLAAQSQREVVRARHRTVAAMAAQTVEQGRFLGGRPPYGYRLVDAGPHPNRAHAAWGRRRLQLSPDPATALHVRWMFARRLDGVSVASIARELNERGVPCPSSADPERNRHRSGQRWNLRSVAVILANPRYTGREVWHRRQSAGPSAGELKGMQAEAVVSRTAAHPALVSEADFVAVQLIRAARVNDDGGVRRYLFTGLIVCGVCGRRMDAHWVNGRAGYRCRHGHSSARPASRDHPGNLYVREDTLLAQLIRAWVSEGNECDVTSAEVLAHLRSRAMVIAHDRAGWRLVSRDEL
jgi:site-specific DNA recombinase